MQLSKGNPLLPLTESVYKSWYCFCIVFTLKRQPILMSLVLMLP